MLSYLFMKILEGRPRSYDRLMDKVSRGQVKTVKEAVVAEVPEGAHVLEMGCGTGELAAMLIARGATVTGFDLSPTMVEVARDRIEAEGLKDKLTIEQMGVDGMDGFPASSFDAVVSTLVLSELSDDERRFALKHSKRVLKPGGIFVIADEVVPRTASGKVLQALVRIPMKAATYFVSRTSTHPIADLPGELKAAAFAVQKEIRSQGDAFALVVAKCQERSEG
jgi:demethylmenaquinone methyltransferase/2-methoxy-6-polyprenyl-1,4-benzoquinol methylase